MLVTVHSTFTVLGALVIVDGGADADLAAAPFRHDRTLADGLIDQYRSSIGSFHRAYA